jgi:hypothetical protein
MTMPVCSAYAKTPVPKCLKNTTPAVYEKHHWSQPSKKKKKKKKKGNRTRL